MRLIDADAVANHLKERLIETALNNVGIMASADDVYREMAKNRIDVWIDEIPTADVVEVVRCKDCKWFNDWGCAIRIIDDTDKPKENDFCSFAERQKDGRPD